MSVHTESSPGPYNVLVVLSAFKNAVDNDGITIDLPKFIIAYKELIKFFDNLGKIFTFVAADLIDKFQNLERCLSIEKTHYLTIQSMIEFEKENKAYMINQNGTLSVLRLIRGLDFIRKLIDNISHNIDNNKKSPELAQQAYDQTLSHRHHWGVRKLVKAGFYLLPRKNDLIEVMLSGSDTKYHQRKEVESLFTEFFNAINKVYSIIHKIYDENNYLELVLA